MWWRESTKLRFLKGGLGRDGVGQYGGRIVDLEFMVGIGYGVQRER